MRRPIGLVAFALGLAAVSPAVAGAQAQAPWMRPAEPIAAPVPFEVGEFLEYKVKLGILNAGEGSLEVAAIESVRGTPAYRAVMRIDGGVLFARVHDVFQTWFDTRTLTSLRFIQDQNEVGIEALSALRDVPGARGLGTQGRRRDGRPAHIPAPRRHLLCLLHPHPAAGSGRCLHLQQVLQGHRATRSSCGCCARRRRKSPRASSRPSWCSRSSAPGDSSARAAGPNCTSATTTAGRSCT